MENVSPWFWHLKTKGYGGRDWTLCGFRVQWTPRDGFVAVTDYGEPTNGKCTDQEARVTCAGCNHALRRN